MVGILCLQILFLVDYQQKNILIWLHHHLAKRDQSLFLSGFKSVYKHGLGNMVYAKKLTIMVILSTCVSTAYMLYAPSYFVQEPERFYRYPELTQSAQKASNYIRYLKTKTLNTDIDVDHRLLLENFISQVKKQKTGYDRLRALQSLEQVNILNPFVDAAFGDMGIKISLLYNDVIRVFDVLIPTMYLLHTYFDTLEENARGRTKELFRDLHNIFLVSVKDYANQLYLEGMYFYNRKGTQQGSFLQEALSRFQKAQGLLHVIKNFDQDALALYNTLDKLEPTAFKRKLIQVDAAMRGDLPLPGT